MASQDALSTELCCLTTGRENETNCLSGVVKTLSKSVKRRRSIQEPSAVAEFRFKVLIGLITSTVRASGNERMITTLLIFESYAVKPLHLITQGRFMCLRSQRHVQLTKGLI